jgi:hypothetical protein
MKRTIGLLILLCALLPAVFAQDAERHIHEPFDMLLGINFGLGGMGSGDVRNLKEGYAVFAADLGLSYDFYIRYWLSVTSGLMLHPQMTAILNEDVGPNSNISFGDVLQAPLCLTIPVQVHVNVPRMEWLYVGVGVNINIPVQNLLSNVALEENNLPVAGARTFFSLPIDFGADLMSPGRGGVRFFYRVTPTFLETKTVVPVGFVWQFYNFRIFHKK